MGHMVHKQLSQGSNSGLSDAHALNCYANLAGRVEGVE